MSYKKIFPLALVILFFLSLFAFFNSKAKVENQYQSYLHEARENKEVGVHVDAIDYYKKAIEIKKEPEVYIEFANYLRDLDLTNEAIELSKSFTQEFSKNVEGYEFLIELYNNEKDYKNLFKTYREFKSRKLTSENIDKIYSKVEYYFITKELPYNEILSTTENIIVVKGNKDWTYLDSNGEMIGEHYKYIGPFSNDRSAVEDSDARWTYIDSSGSKRHSVDNIHGLTELGILTPSGFVAKADNMWRVYNLNNEIIAGPYESVTNINDGYLVAKVNNNYNLLNIKDVTSVQLPGEAITDENNIAFNNEALFVREENTVSLYNNKGEKILGEFEDAKPFNDSYAAVKKNGKWGFVDNGGNLIIDYIYDDARSFKLGHAAVKKNNKWGLINEEEKLVIEYKYDDMKDMTDNGTLVVKEDNLWKVLIFYKYN